MRAVCVSMLLLAMTVAAVGASSHGESYAAAGYNFAEPRQSGRSVEVTGRVYGRPPPKTKSPTCS